MPIDLQRETTLGALAIEPEGGENAFLFAVVVDFAEPAAHRLGYLVKLKVIDPSFNFSVKERAPNLRFSRFCHVNIHAASWAAAPKVRWAGEIIRLRRFKFEIGDKGELVAFERTRISNWMLFSPFEGCDQHLSAKSSFTKNLNRELTDFESRRLQDLRVWARQFFGHYSLTSIIWWNALTAAQTAHVDLLLRVARIDAQRPSLEFTDRWGRRFSLQVSAAPALTVGDVIKLRCVNVRPCVSSRRFDIELTARSSCMLLPDFFGDAKCIAPLAAFEEARVGFASMVASGKANIRPTSLRRLRLILERRAALHLNDTFLVEAQLEKLLLPPPEDSFKRVVCVDRPDVHRIYVHLVLLLRERPQRLQVHLAEAIDSPMLSEPARPHFGSPCAPNVPLLLQRLQRMAARRPRLRLLLRLLIAKSGEPFYRVVDSAFVF